MALRVVPVPTIGLFATTSPEARGALGAIPSRRAAPTRTADRPGTNGRHTHCNFVDSHSSRGGVLSSCARLQPGTTGRRFAHSPGHHAEARVDLGIVLLGLAGLAIVLALMHVLGRMASEREANQRRKDPAHRKQQRIVPLSDDTITHLGHS
jgi:hypothetical protein